MAQTATALIIQCDDDDGCGKWYHATCGKILVREAKVVGDRVWLCPECKGQLNAGETVDHGDDHPNDDNADGANPPVPQKPLRRTGGKGPSRVPVFAQENPSRDEEAAGVSPAPTGSDHDGDLTMSDHDDHDDEPVQHDQGAAVATPHNPEGDVDATFEQQAISDADEDEDFELDHGIVEGGGLEADGQDNLDAEMTNPGAEGENAAGEEGGEGKRAGRFRSSAGSGVLGGDGLPGERGKREQPQRTEPDEQPGRRSPLLLLPSVSYDRTIACFRS